jgi:hypothetical protein
LHDAWCRDDRRAGRVTQHRQHSSTGATQTPRQTPTASGGLAALRIALGCVLAGCALLGALQRTSGFGGG